MTILLTGATGYVGSVLLEHLIRSGQAVRALARSSQSAAHLAARGAQPVRGHLAHSHLLRDEISAASAVVHTAFDRGPAGVAADLAFTEAVLAAAPRDLTHVHVSDTWGYGPLPRELDEESAAVTSIVHSSAPHGDRYRADALVLAAAATHRRYLVRPAPLIHGRGGNNLLPQMIESARVTGRVQRIGDGRNAWGAVDVDDLASLLLLLLERRPAPGLYHAVAENVPMAAVMQAIATSAGAEVEELDPRVAASLLGPLAHVLTLEQRLSARRSLEAGWVPQGRDVVTDIVSGSYASAAHRPRTVATAQYGLTDVVRAGESPVS